MARGRLTDERLLGAAPLADVFGDGGHPSTRLAARALADELAARPPGARVLDAGCGTGVLAAEAAARGARVTAIDRHIEAARRTATRVPAAMTLCAELATLKPAPRFDVVVANLPERELFALIPALAGWLARGGCLLATGVLLCRATALGRRLEGAGLARRPAAALAGWALQAGVAAATAST